MTSSDPGRPRTACPIASPHRRQGISRGNRALDATGQVFEAKGQARLLKDLPQHRLAPGCKTFFEPVASRHEIINPGARLECVLDRQGMSDNAGPLPTIGVGKPALIGINPISQPKIIEVADDPAAGGEAALDQQPVEPLEEPPGERMVLAATLPGSTMQHLQLRKEGERLCRRLRCAELQPAVALEMSEGAAKLLTGVGA